MAGDLHPGSFVGDSIEEFKQLPTWGKIAIGGGLILAIFLFLKMRSSASGASVAASPSSTDASTSGAGSSAFPMTNGVPVLPSNVNPVYDPSGGLVGYQQNPPAATGQPIVAGPITPPTHTGGQPPTPRPTPTPPKLQTYTVVHGDTLSGIASRLHYQGGWQALYAKNKGVVGSNPNLIIPGQKLVL